MSTTPTTLFSLLPAIYRTRDAQQGGQLEALFTVLESQYGIVRENLLQLYDDQFIETCAPWVIPYLGELIGFNTVYTAALATPDSRAEVANTIGYRRRKGTLVALEQMTHDVSGRTTMAVEEFRRLVTTLSLRDLRPRHSATANLRRAADWQDEDNGGPFTRLNRTLDVRRIAPRVRVASSPDTAPLDIALHGPGHSNVSEVAVWMWRWQSWAITNAPVFPLPAGGYLFNQLGCPVPLFQKMTEEIQPFASLVQENDVPEPISRRRFAARTAHYYPASVELIADGQPVPITRIVSANLASACSVPRGKIAVDPELGRIEYATDLPLPRELRVSFHYGSPAPIGGGPYDRSASIVTPTANAARLNAIVGSTAFPTFASAIAAWNRLPQNSAGTIVLPNFETYAVDLTGPHAIQIPAESQLLIAAAQLSGSTPLWTNSRVTLHGDIEVSAPPSPLGPDGLALPMGQVRISGLCFSGELRLLGGAACVQITDSTLVPGWSRTSHGTAAFPGEASVSGLAIGMTLSLTRVITGAIALSPSCTVRICASIVDAGSLFCPAFAGPDLSSPGAVLHIEDSTVIGRVWAQTIRLASNTIFHARIGLRDPWKAAVWAQRVQTGCIRFCSLPWNSITPRRYECLPPDAASEPALEPKFITLRFGEPGYCLLSGDTPLAVWKGADNGSQIGVFLQIQETEAAANIQIRSAEYLPANLEAGVFLIPSQALREQAPPKGRYGYPILRQRNHCVVEGEDVPSVGIGSKLI